MLTPFVAAVIRTLRTQPSNCGVDAYTLREALMWQGHGKHPAAVAMHLTKLAWKAKYVTSYMHNDSRMFMLTKEGLEVELPPEQKKG